MYSTLRDFWNETTRLHKVMWLVISASPLYADTFWLKILWFVLLFVHIVLAWVHGYSSGKQKMMSDPNTIDLKFPPGSDIHLTENSILVHLPPHWSINNQDEEDLPLEQLHDD